MENRYAAVNKRLKSSLNFIADQMDSVARFGRHRLVKESDLGIAYGEHTLGRLISMLSVDTVFDIGANVGQYALELRNKVGFRGQIISYEPLPQAVQELRALAKNDPKWQINQIAIDAAAGKAQFNVMVGDQFSSLLNPSEQFAGRFNGQHVVQDVIEVEVITLATAVKEAPPFKVALLKLDTQGTELRILQGGQDCLDRFSAIQLEVGFQSLYEGESGFSEIVDTMNAWGYGLCALFPNNRGHFPHLLEMDAVFLRKNLFPDLR